ncbi:hypothetical protein EHI8A_240470 [Entamoeba histolytica HM-1:IMSS-B]|uniref:Uncharacterized protein n=4 Tax=Entamoeba histolytica TaxID=5759 RepID=M3U486_ENTH1|nr:hypothetical protein EHI8A_240470 [Entamoeba histolytica HM-1:IMSS-B]EMS17036.1 hypothetical protein KM1_302410 [Entamoeba histolytica HM-3:IMSS]ENY63968.1 hypothetical protein EHI7A_199150 [Entamoeba histolytica HM-1:IMSS-A]
MKPSTTRKHVYQRLVKMTKKNLSKELIKKEIYNENNYNSFKKIQEKNNKTSEILKKEIQLIENNNKDSTEEINQNYTDETSITEECQWEYSFEKYKDMSLAIKALVKTIHPIANTKWINRWSNLIIHNLILYGITVKEWKENEQFRVLDIENLQRKVVDQIVLKYRKHEVIIKAIFVDKVRKILNSIKKGHKITIEHIYPYISIPSHWGYSCDIALFTEIIEKGNEMYLEYIDNPIIKYYLLKHFGVIDREKQIKIIKTRLSYLTLLFNI